MRYNSRILRCALVILSYILLTGSICISDAYANISSDLPPDPCATGLLALINRPSPSGGVCSVPNKQVIVEGGYQYFNLSGGAYGYVTPQTIIRFGLPQRNEFLLITPTYFHQTISPRAGWSAVTLSMKHEIDYNANWVGAVEGLVTLPTGSDAYGARALGETVNGVVSYTVNPVVNITGTLGVMSTSVQYINNGQRFTSVNPDVFVTWQLTSKMQLFAELYAQTRTGPHEGWGILADGGIYYLLMPRMTLDAELGQRINGAWGFQNYVSGGFAVLFG